MRFSLALPVSAAVAASTGRLIFWRKAGPDHPEARAYAEGVGGDLFLGTGWI